MNTLETVSLSFDDGPDRAWTPKVLEQLRRSQVTATFFMVGERVRSNPEIARQVKDHGHELQLHCDRHIRHSELNAAELAGDTERALQALAAVGVRPRLWRPPWGICTEATAAVAERYGLQVRRWSIDTHDWRGDSAEAMLAAARPLIAGGGSVLMHDAIGPGATREGCQNTVELIPSLAREVRRQGLEMAPMQPAPRALARS